jgi:Mn2+/Fe2+ NRAMP family transporter
MMIVSEIRQDFRGRCSKLNIMELDMFLCVFLSTVNALLFLLVLPLLGKHCAEVLSISITGLVLLFFALSSLSTDSNAGSIVNGMIPRVKRESLYTAVALLGANIMPHNFYLHSLII